MPPPCVSLLMSHVSVCTSMWNVDKLRQGIILGTVCLVAIFCTGQAAVSSDHECKRTCRRGEPPKLCVYNFTVEWYRTLSKACHDCPFNKADCFRPHCVSGDGRVKAIITVNRQVPGPSIEVCAGDEVVVWVTNDMEDGQATSIHWHGVHQVGTPYSDGVGLVTQCNIGVGETFRYKFKPSPVGTHWYHSHTGMQLADGLFGPLIVRQPKDADPNGALYDVDDRIMLVGDWIPVTSMTRYVDLMHDLYDSTLPQGLHVNGRGRYANVTNRYNMVDTNLTYAQTPLEVFEVETNKSYLFRVIGSSGNCPVQVSFEGHQLQVLASDGISVKPRPVDVFIIFPGERYDVLLTAVQPARSYWIKVLGLGDCLRRNWVTHAVLRYAGTPATDPSTDPNFSTLGKIMMNHVPMQDGQWREEYGKGHVVFGPHELEFAGSEVNLTDQIVDARFYIGMELLRNDHTKYNHRDLYNISSLAPRKAHLTPVMDNITFLLPPVPLLSQPEDVIEEWFCNRSSLGDSDRCLTDLCRCIHTLRFQKDQVVELIFINEAKTSNEIGHPLHLHGHSFFVLGLGKINASFTSRDEIMSLDKQGRLPRNYINPPFRDTVNIPDASYAILRFEATNPGYWFFHCHTDSHLAQGKAMLIKVGDYPDFPPVPDTFPKCGGWGYSNADRRTTPPPSCPGVTNGGVKICGHLGSFVIMGFVSLFILH